MEWEKEMCLQLIDEYEKQELLWNPRHGSYYNKSKKNEAWILISRAVGCSTKEIKKKMESLLASYRRENAKGKKAIGNGKGAHQVYVSKWFAFNKMAFLRDRAKPRCTISNLADLTQPALSNTGEEDVSEITDTVQDIPCYDDFDEDIKTNVDQLESSSSTPASTSNATNPSNAMAVATVQIPQDSMAGKRKCLEDELVMTASKKLKTFTNKRDQLDSFGENVSQTLRQMTREQAVHAQKLISDVLYEGQLGGLSRLSYLVSGADSTVN